MKITNYRNEKLFFYVPLVSFITFVVLMIMSLVLRSDYYYNDDLYIKYPVVILLFTASLIITKFVHNQIGLYFFLSIVYFGAWLFDVYNIPSLGIFLLLFLYLILISLFLLNRIFDLFFVGLFYLSAVCRIFSFPQDWGGRIGDFVLVSLFVFTMVQVKYWIVGLVQYKESSLQRMQNTTLCILGKVSELRDKETTDHLKRVEVLIDSLTGYLSEDRNFAAYITRSYKMDMKSAAFLHDIGKIGIPDSLLNKEGPLSEDEFSIMQTHTLIGYNIIKEAQKEMNSESIYDLALEIVRHHHERWDGTGYPDGLKGEAIPLSARIMAVVDAYDALISKRSYKPALCHKEAIEIIEDDGGSHFDPDIVRVFLEHSQEIKHLLDDYLE